MSNENNSSFNHTLKHIYTYCNPKYIIHFSMEGEQYFMNIESKIHLELKGSDDHSNLNTFRVIISKLLPSKFAQMIEDVELKGNKEFEKFISEWYEKADS